MQNYCQAAEAACIGTIIMEDDMPTRSFNKLVGIGIIMLGATLGAGALAQQATFAPLIPSPGCHFGEIIDSSTAEQAKVAIEASGFTQVTGLKKSCDNFWHGYANQNGRAVNVVLSPAGRVLLEGS